MAGADAWAVRATKKGDLPIIVEKRGQHKVTVVRNVERPELLSSALGKALGAGGSVSATGAVEVQGQLTARVEAFLRSNPTQVHGVRRIRPTEPQQDKSLVTSVDSTHADNRRHAAGKARHVKAKATEYVLAGANDDVVTATIRAAQAADDEDDDDAGSCCDLISAEEAWVVQPEERRLRRLAQLVEPEPELLITPATVLGSSLDAALRDLGMLAFSSAIDDRGKNRSERKAKVAERRETRTAELQDARAARAAERRSSAHSWWPAPLPVPATLATPAPTWIGKASVVQGGAARVGGLQRVRRPSASLPAKRQPQAKRRIPSAGRAKGRQKSGARSQRARPLWEDELASSVTSRHDDEMSDDIDQYLFGDENASDEDRASASLDGYPTTSSSATLASFVESSGVTGETAGWEVWPEEETPQAPATVDAYTILREGGDEAVQALVAAENWRDKFEDIIVDVLGDPLFGFEQRDATDHCGSVLPLVGQFPWHVMAVRWLDGDSAEDSFVAALDTALREREADADYSEHEARVEASHDLEPEPAFQVDESLFYDSDDEEADGTMKSSLAPASVEHGIYPGVTISGSSVFTDTRHPCLTAYTSASQPTGTIDADWDEAVGQLIELGFDDGAAIADALSKSNGALEPALELLCAPATETGHVARVAGEKTHKGAIDEDRCTARYSGDEPLEFRIDTADGRAYSKDEFVEEYGPHLGAERWAASTLLGTAESETVELPPQRDWDSLRNAGLDPLRPKKKIPTELKQPTQQTQQQPHHHLRRHHREQQGHPGDQNVDQLMEMGFSRPRAQKALAQTRGDACAAMELLLADIA